MNSRVREVFGPTFSSLKIPNYRLFFYGQSISLIGTWMQMTAQSWLVLVLTHSSTDIGFVVAIQTLPVLLLAPYGGVIADRIDKRRLMVVLQTAMGLQALTLGLLTVFHAVRLWEVCVLAVILGLNNAFEAPSRQAFVREMVNNDVLRNAVTLNSVMMNAARAVGPAVGGIIIGTVGVGYCFLVNAASFIAVVTSLLMMNKSKLRPSDPTVRERGQLREGLRYAMHTPPIAVPLLMMGLVGMLAFEFQVSLPVLATATFHGGSEAYGYMSGVMGVGAVLGGLISATRNRMGFRSMIYALVGFGTAILFVSLSPTLAIAYILLFFVGWASISFTAIATSTIQLNAVPNMRGRTVALWQVAFQGTTPIGGPFIGWIISESDPRVGMAVGAASCFIAVGAGIVVSRRFRSIAAEANAADAEDVLPEGDLAAEA